MPYFGGIEAGGSKFVCACGTGPADAEIIEFRTTSPNETVGQAIEFFSSRMPLDAIASFGPVDLNRDSPTFGFITSTPKLAWRSFDFVGAVGNALDLPVAFDTDVNAAALAESDWGAARGVRNFIYLTVGTGLGGGAIIDGHLLHGRVHAEMGHVRVPHDRTRDPFPGNCPYHGDCLEGLAAAPAIEARWSCAAHDLPDGHAAWDLEAEYLALGIANWSCTLSPQRIILGGGVMHRDELFPHVRERVAKLVNHYFEPPDIVPPGLGQRSGVLGAIALASRRWLHFR
jgi:fructokinase